MDLIKKYSSLSSGYIYAINLGCEEVHYGTSDGHYFAHRIRFLTEEKNLSVVNALKANMAKPFTINDVDSNFGYIVKGKDMISIDIYIEDEYVMVTITMQYIQKQYLN